jgi:hypothetical protein
MRLLGLALLSIALVATFACSSGGKHIEACAGTDGGPADSGSSSEDDCDAGGSDGGG